jgi:hypothetical protein
MVAIGVREHASHGRVARTRAAVAVAVVSDRPLVVVTPEDHLRRNLVRVDHPLDDFHLATGDAAQHRDGLQIVGVAPRQRQQLLLEVPDGGGVAERRFALEALLEQRHLVERVEPAVRAHDLQRAFDCDERKRVLVVLAVEHDQTHELVA